MIAMTWRQHRAQLLIGAAAVVAWIAYMMITRQQHASFANSIGLSSCLADKARDCGTLAAAFINRFGGFPQVFTLIAGLPLLAGLFWGAPLIAREVETGTFRLAWTQSVGRGRWLTVKLVTFFAAIVVAAVALSLSFSLWLHIYSQISEAGYTNIDRLAPPAFDFTGIAPFATMLFAFALGTAAGAVIRRTVPAMAVTLGAYLGVILPLESWRYTVLTPLTKSGPFTAGSLPSPPGAYMLSSGYATAGGQSVPFSYLAQVCGTAQGTHSVGIKLSCLAAKGFRVSEIYQPAARYWPLQGIYSASLVVVAAILLGIAVWWTVRRIR
jgi:hypothetical protein